MMNKIILGLTACFSLWSSFALASAQNNIMHGLYNERYCEIAVIENKHQWSDYWKFKVHVYNTIGLNHCPEALWSQLNANDLAKQLQVKKVLLNGPRYLLMNAIQVDGDVKTKKEIEVGGIAMKKGAEISTNVFQMMQGNHFYNPKTVDRKKNTVFFFNAGNTVYELIAPDGTTYIMQSYSQKVDPNLNLSNLESLRARMQLLPKGWKYNVRVLDKTLEVEAVNKRAYIVSDEFENSYQQIEAGKK